MVFPSLTHWTTLVLVETIKHQSARWTTHKCTSSPSRRTSGKKLKHLIKKRRRKLLHLNRKRNSNYPLLEDPLKLLQVLTPRLMPSNFKLSMMLKMQPKKVKKKLKVVTADATVAKRDAVDRVDKMIRCQEWIWTSETTMTSPCSRISLVVSISESSSRRHLTTIILLSTTRAPLTWMNTFKSWNENNLKPSFRLI